MWEQQTSSKSLVIQDASIGPSVSADSLASETPWSNCRVQWSPLRATTDRIALTLPTHLTRLTPHSLQLQALKHQHRTAPQGVRQLLRPTASHEVLRELHQTDEACGPDHPRGVRFTGSVVKTKADETMQRWAQRWGQDS